VSRQGPRLREPGSAPREGAHPGRQRQTIDVLPARDRKAVAEVALMTSEIRQHSKDISAIAAKRQRRVAALRARGVTIALIAREMGVSMQAVQKILAEPKPVTGE
jgi:DNA-binding NarL/FixJ family response regulator